MWGGSGLKLNSGSDKRRSGSACCFYFFSEKGRSGGFFGARASGHL